MVGVRPMFLADWAGALFIHFRADPDALSRVVPFELDIRDGDAWLKQVIANYTADGDAEIVAAYTDLRKVMRATLSGKVSLVHAAAKPGLPTFHKARVFLVGTAHPSGIAGLMSYSVET